MDRAVAEDEALKVAQRFGTFGDKDLAAVLRTTPRAVASRLAKLVEQGKLIDLERKVNGQRMFEYVETPEQAVETRAEAIRVGRDWVTAKDQRGKAWTPSQLKQAAELTDDETDAVTRRDRERRPRGDNVGTGGRGLVEGTGKKMVINDPDVRVLVEACQAAGATVTRATNQHLRVAYGSKSVNISSTPSNRRTVMNDRARVRRNLGLKIAG